MLDTPVVVCNTTRPRRPIVGVRIKPEAIAYIDALAKAEGVKRSEMIRRLVGEALVARQRKGQR